MVDVEWVEFSKYGMSKAFLIDKKILHDFDKSLSDVMMVAKLNGYSIQCSDKHSLMNLDKTRTICVFSFIKESKVLFNIVINAVDKKKFSTVDVVCIKDYHSTINVNYDLFQSTFAENKFNEKNKKNNSESITLSNIKDIVKGFGLLEKLTLLFQTQ